MAKEFKNGERVEFRPWEIAPAKDRVAGEIVGGVVEGEYYMMLPDWAKRKGETVIYVRTRTTVGR